MYMREHGAILQAGLAMTREFQNMEQAKRDELRKGQVNSWL
jgi:hypothetical protein